jgi:hypothetical protein
MRPSSKPLVDIVFATALKEPLPLRRCAQAARTRGTARSSVSSSMRHVLPASPSLTADSSQMAGRTHGRGVPSDPRVGA